MKFLHLIGTLNPQYGGPVEVLRQFSEALPRFGHDSRTLALDPPDAPWIRDFPGEVYALGRGLGTYGYSKALVPWLLANGGEYDALIVHGIWQYKSLASWRVARRLGTPWFLFVHGAMDPWFRRYYPLKHLKKLVYWSLFERRVFRDATAVLYTCEQERLLAGGEFPWYRAEERIVSLGIQRHEAGMDSAAAFLGGHPELRGKRLWLFISRIHPKKGCEVLIRAFARVAPLDQRLQLLIAGPDQLGWAAELKGIANRLGVSERIQWLGMIEGDEKWGALNAAEAFLLPSHSENFGVVVAEALSQGLPVLISDKVNIWREVERAGAGMVCEDRVDATAAEYLRWLGLDDEARARMRHKARVCFDQHFHVDASVRSLERAVFECLRAVDR